MKIAMIPINVGVKNVEEIIGLAQLAEANGFESVWTFEHVIVPNNYESRYPYAADGKMGATPETNFFDPLIAITAAAVHTKTLRFGTGVNILSQANPLFFAKQAASLDVISNGRLMLGLGIGWLKEEFTAMGVPFERRGARFDDYVEAIRKVWAGDTVEHQSDFINWSGFKSYPVPQQKPGIPIVMGGATGKIYQRVAQHGDGWYIPDMSIDGIKAHIDKLQLACNEAGRDLSEIELTVMFNPEDGLDHIKRLQDIGVHRATAFTTAFGDDMAAGMGSLNDAVISRL